MTSKPRLILTAAACLLALPLFGAASPGPKARIFAKYDTNKNGSIDGDEVAAVRAAFKAEPTGEFGRYDANSDGKLDDAEIAAIKPPGQEPKIGGKKSGGARTEKK